MKFDPPLIETTLLCRYKRFLADVLLPNGEEMTVHCPNPGKMLGLDSPGNRCWISDSQNPKRKLLYTLEMMEVDAPAGKVMVGINTNWPNKLTEIAIKAGKFPGLDGYANLKREVKYGVNSRIDILLSDDNRRDCYVEIKNVHLLRQNGLYEFPDCVTARGAKHLRELSTMVKEGHRAVMLYVIQRMDGDKFALARDLDPVYAENFDLAMQCGVEALAIRCKITPGAIEMCDMVPVVDVLPK